MAAHCVGSSLVFGYYQVRQDAWLLRLASEDLRLNTPVIGAGAHHRGHRPTTAKLQYLGFSTFFLFAYRGFPFHLGVWG